ncbi:MAG: transporter [Fluviicola sp.]|nr:transporter [Fluviicola sp.]
MMKLILTTAIIAFCTSLNAQKIVTDRPDQTESSATVPKNSLQIESGVIFQFSENNGTSVKEILAPTTLFRIGVFKWAELRILNQFESNKFGNNQRIKGISDLEIGTKIQLLKNSAINTEIALLSHVLLPTGSRELTNNNYGTINKLSISHSLGENLDLGYNIGYNSFEGYDGDLTYSLALGIGLSDKVGMYIEPYGEWVNFQSLAANMDAGFTYLLQENLQFDFSFGLGLNYNMNYISAGVSWLIVR